jgi:hypothetical protein
MCSHCVPLPALSWDDIRWGEIEGREVEGRWKDQGWHEVGSEIAGVAARASSDPSSEWRSGGDHRKRAWEGSLEAIN